MRETIHEYNKKTLHEKKNLFLYIDSFFVSPMYRVVVIYCERLRLGSRHCKKKNEIRTG